MNILLLGSGGREHAFAYHLSKSTNCTKLYIAPGNAGTKLCGENVNLSILDFDAIAQFAIKNTINLIIVGPEDPLVKGIYDYFKNDITLNHIHVLGPSKISAQLEGSKSFAKEFMQKQSIPTAAYQSFDSNQIQEAKAFALSMNCPIVIKADGLAAGKGVIIAQNYEEAIYTIDQILAEGVFGDAGNKVVIEQFLTGLEMSCFLLTNGSNYYWLPDAKDYKKIFEGDLGPNTGGMGAISPVPFMDNELRNKIKTRIIEPTIQGLQANDMAYYGFIFFGLINVNGDPFVIEYNCRMGDPETEVVLNRIDSDLLDLIINCLQNDFSKPIEISDKHSSTVILVSEGYPEKYQKGFDISGFEKIHSGILFHAGTIQDDDKILTNGGRVFACSALENNLEKALKTSYEMAETINYKGKKYRKDIGYEFKN